MGDEILQDFLLEAGEILEQLDSQLVELESEPTRSELLNAVFRGFHTIKGGAGFLGLQALVTVSHKSEDLFGLLRDGRLRLDPPMMDSFLQVLDVLRGMFDALGHGADPENAPAALLDRLDAHAAALDSVPKDTQGPASNTAREADGAAADLITETEFDALLDQRDGEPKRAASEASADKSKHDQADLITEDEFEALLDQRDLQQALAAEREATPAAPADLISEEEFEAVLDELHGPGRFDPAIAETAATTGRSCGGPPPAGEFSSTETDGEKPRSANAARSATKADSTVRVETRTLDRIMNMVGELVLIRNRLSNLQTAVEDENVAQAIDSLDVVTSDLQMAAMKTRMQPIRKVFGRFPRVVRDLARTLGKEVELEMSGEDTDLDKNLVEALADPLIHLVRNSVDHGIESPDGRIAAGKKPAGRISLGAEQAGDQIQLVIADDGKGIDAEALRSRSVKAGLLDADAAARLSTRECYELIFLPGFSTKQEVSDISGRGVGMDVVKTRITQLNGTITIDSTMGGGTTIVINVPLTLAIMPTLMVVLGSQVFALPLVNVQEIIDFRSDQAREVDGRQTMVVRGRAIPLFYLSSWLVREGGAFDAETGHVVVTRIGGQSVGLLVDELIGQEEVVIKPLGALLQGTRGLAGATITGNGRIALIIDLPGLLDAYARR